MHTGPPTWDGKYVTVGPIAGKVFPVVLGQPFVICIDGSNDLFFMIFSNEEKLKETTEKIIAKLGMPNEYGVGRIREKEFIDAILDYGIRIMHDPVVIDDNHTKWGEIIRDGDEYKFIQKESE